MTRPVRKNNDLYPKAVKKIYIKWYDIIKGYKYVVKLSRVYKQTVFQVSRNFLNTADPKFSRIFLREFFTVLPSKVSGNITQAPLLLSHNRILVLRTFTTFLNRKIYYIPKNLKHLSRIFYCFTSISFGENYWISKFIDEQQDFCSPCIHIWLIFFHTSDFVPKYLVMRCIFHQKIRF